MIKPDNHIHKIINIFLDPLKRKKESDFFYTESNVNNCKAIYNKAIREYANFIIIKFEKSKIIKYILMSLKIKFTLPVVKVRKVYYVNDGLLSSVFDADNVKTYHYFARNHLPKPKGLIHKFTSYIPIILRAEERYIIFEKSTDMDPLTESTDDFMPEFNFTMFSNESGKLIFTNTKTLQYRNGVLIKTTANADYREVMKKEFKTLEYISNRLGESGCIPKVGKIYDTDNAFYFTEDYIDGQNLKDILYAFAEKGLSAEASAIIEKLDVWHKNIRLTLSAQPKKISLFYAAVVEKFTDLYGDNYLIYPVIDNVIHVLTSIDRTHSGLVPMVTHNDLWPANLIVTTDNIIAIDWERATEDQSGIFDYYWMMISTAIVYLKDEKKLSDYSCSFRRFVNNCDDISKCVHSKLKNYLIESGFNAALYDSFILLFLLEWSIQGYEHLNKQTDMDKLAFNELLEYSYKNNSQYLKTCSYGQ